jgi:hypothetical protein
VIKAFVGKGAGIFFRRFEVHVKIVGPFDVFGPERHVSLYRYRQPPGFSNSLSGALLFLFFQQLQNLVWIDGQLLHPHPGGVIDRICDGREHA